MISKRRPWVNEQSGERGVLVWIWCPGCEEAHALEVESSTKARWTWNGSEEKPTFSPSLLVTYGGGDARRCHSFIRDGRIQFLGDCTHALKGQTVDLPPLPDWLVK